MKLYDFRITGKCVLHSSKKDKKKMTLAPLKNHILQTFKDTCKYLRGEV